MAKKKMQMPETAGPDKDWQADSDCRTLIEAKEIMADKERHRAAMKKAKEKMATLKEVSKEAKDA